MSYPTPIRVIVQPMGAGTKRVILRCRCVTVGRHYPVEVGLPEAIAELLADHRRQAPLCRHTAPSLGATR